MCVREDWFADKPGDPTIPRPKFCDLDFERTFAVTRSHVEHIIIPAVTGHRPDVFCLNEKDASGEKGIALIVRVLSALKVARFGVGMGCFKDYFQIGEQTTRDAFYALMDSMHNHRAVKAKYLRPMTRMDLSRIMRLHKEQHGVDGMAFSIDCWHLDWKNCPVAWQGQLKGKEGKATLVLEAGCDHNLWFWHVLFGYPGTMNDIQIWEQSTLLQAISSGQMGQGS